MDKKKENNNNMVLYFAVVFEIVLDNVIHHFTEMYNKDH